MRLLTPSIFILIVWSFSLSLKGQPYIDTPDGRCRPEVLQKVLDIHFPDQHIKKIRGRQYINLYPTIIEHQFFRSKDPFEGILYTSDNTIFYSNLMYDIYRDKLIAYHRAAKAFIELEGEFIRRFKLYENEGDLEFVNVELKKGRTGIQQGGFFQVLFESERLDLLRKHYKTYAEVLTQRKYQVQFKKQERLVMRKGNLYFTVRNKRDLLKHYPESETELKRYFRRSRVNFRNSSDSQLTGVAQYLDNLVLEYDRVNTNK